MGSAANNPRLNRDISTRRIVAVLIGTVWALAFPTFNIAGLAWITPALLILLALGTSPRLSFQLGWIAGFTFQLITLRWLLNIPVTFLPILGWIALSAFLALFPGLWLRLAWSWFPKLSMAGIDNSTGSTFGSWKSGLELHRQTQWLQRVAWTLTVACLWVAWEMTQTRIFSGFPWNLLGTSQTSMLIFTQIAEFTGVYGVSFVMVVSSLSLLHAGLRLLMAPHERWIWQRELMPALLFMAITGGYGWNRLQSFKAQDSSGAAPRTEIRVALIQPSIPQTMIWNGNEDENRFEKLLELSRKALAAKPDLMLWPEASAPFPLRLDRTSAQIVAEMLRNQPGSSWLAAGSDDAELVQKPDGKLRTNYYNSAFLLNPTGAMEASYKKRHLVMFGEFVPLSEWLPFLRYLTPITGGFTPGGAPVAFTLPVSGKAGPQQEQQPKRQVSFGVLICFEDGFPHLVREHSRGVDFLVNITNDGWFGEGGAQWQHTASAAFRAIENRMPLVRCSNNGISCLIDELGRVQDVAPKEAATVYGADVKVVTVTLPSAPVGAGGERSMTLYQKYGDWFGWGAVAVSLVAWVKGRMREKRGTAAVLAV